MRHLCFWLALLPGLGWSAPDTLRFFSPAFGTERQAFVHLPEDMRYGSDSVRYPVIYLLDGQHEWFAEPVLNDIEYLQYTHEMPQAIVVVIPHEDRYTECSRFDFSGPALPLHRFLTEDLERQLAAYQPGEFRMLIGHSFSASFALYSFLTGNGFFQAVIAHSPLEQVAGLAAALDSLPDRAKDDIAISIGGAAADRDRYHRRAYDQAKAAHPDLFSHIKTYEANASAHNAVPIVAGPALLAELFLPFSRRFAHIATVDSVYQLIDPPKPPTEELTALAAASRLGSHFYPPEIAEINGVASRYWNNGYEQHSAAIYAWSLQFYPRFFDFHLSLYQLTTSEEAAKTHLLRARELVIAMEMQTEDGPSLLEEINEEIRNRGWE